MSKTKKKIERIESDLIVELQEYVKLDWPCIELKGKYTISDLKSIIVAMKEVQLIREEEEQADPYLKAYKAICDYANTTEDDDEDKLDGLQHLMNLIEDELECLP